MGKNRWEIEYEAEQAFKNKHEIIAPLNKVNNMAKLNVDMTLKVNTTKFKDSLVKVTKSIVDLKATIAELEKQEITVEQVPRENLFDFGMRPVPVTHKKTGDKYWIICTRIPNATNAANNELMILYKNEKGDLFVRESNEFCTKFEIPVTGVWFDYGDDKQANK